MNMMACKAISNFVIPRLEDEECTMEKVPCWFVDSVALISEELSRFEIPCQRGCVVIGGV